MEYYVNSKTEEKTIYEIYKACRLCGAGAGYKMPIIQNVVNLATDEIELKQKIRECVQIEVHQDDKMPPLICELCVDKVNDFYEFMDMCKQTNKKTRLRLGLPPQTLPQGAPDAGDCILGVTEPVYINDDSNEAILTRKSKKEVKNVKSKKEPETKVDSKRRKEETKPTKQFNFSPLRSGRNRQPSPPRLRAGNKRHSDEDQSLSKLQKAKRSEVQPKSILKKASTESLLEPRSKRSRGSLDSPKVDLHSKKVKIAVSMPKKSKPEPRPEPRPEPKPLRSAVKPQYKCTKCKLTYKTPVALSNHVRTHKFQSRKRSPPPKPEPRARSQTCSKCDKSFPLTQFKGHRCIPKPGSVCGKCDRTFLTPQALSSHERTCRKASGGTKIPRALMSKIRPLQVRLRRCDSLLDDTRCRDTAAVAHDFGLDKNYVYPYLNKSSRKVRIKSELAQFDSMVNIQDEIRDEFDLGEYYVHWDSESEVDTDTEMDAEKKKVKKLSTLALKVLFSPKLLGKVPKKLRKIKSEKPFDSILQANETDCDMGLGIDSIINRLDDTNDSERKDEDSLLYENKGPGVSNNDFDSIFNNGDSTDYDDGNKDTNKTDSVTIDPSLDISEKNDELCNISDDSSKKSIDDTDTSKIKVNNTTNLNSSDVNGADNVNSNIESVNDSLSVGGDTDSIVSDKCNNLDKVNEEDKFIEKVSSETKDECSNTSGDTDQCDNVHDESKFNERIDTTRMEEQSCTKNDSDTVDYKNNSGDNTNESDIKDNQCESMDVVNEEKEGIVDRDITDEVVATNLMKEPSTEIDSIQEKQFQDSDKNHSQSDFESNENQQVDLEINESVREAEKDIANEDKKSEVQVNGDSATDKINEDDLEAVSDNDMDDIKLMEALDAQIAGSDTKDTEVTEEILDLRENKQSEHHSVNV